ncbi:S8 family serine peptidase [Ornithinicoccus halotolerans]|uniref:S8 family serine peptidase n=1 Tax=Ornithinicoccus halotolerans TaxID=1748220 RepID=UPI0012958B0E|nr:S8 family serine peptidase [Ornithinicoccus halotolerans]
MSATFALVASTFGAAAGAADTPAAADRGPAEVAEELRSTVAAADGSPVQALIVLDRTPDVMSVEGDRDAVVAEMKSAAAESQSELDEQIERAAQLGDVEVLNRFWITNAVLVEFAGDEATLEAVAALPAADRVVPNFDVTLIEPEEPDLTTADEGPYTWGLERIAAPRIWDELGVTGTGIRVATLDTGVDINHPDLADKMVTVDASDPTYPGGWMEFDSAGNRVESEPHDSAYHGTHVSGTIHGGATSGQAIGVAPTADMMHGLVIPGGGGSFAQVAAGMQWAVDPVDSDGNPAGAPADVVNMSLGGNGFHQEMIQPTINMRAAGIVPAFAIGNNCGSLGTASPGNVYESLAVGNTTVDEDVNGSSCGGVVSTSQWPDPPAHWPDSYIKPDISAPGTDVWSAEPGGGYRYLSGTSMATPHVAGTAALMLSAAPELTPDQIQQTLEDTSVWDDRYSPDRPDTRYGHGRINAYEATAIVAIDSGVTGTVTDAEDGDPVTGATVSVAGSDREVVTGDDGTFTVRLEPGSYDLQAEAFGYEAGTVEDVEVTEETFTEVALELAPAPRGDIAGSVTFVESGDGVPGATVEVLDVPVTFADTTAEDGSYTISEVPEGSYTVAVDRAGFSNPAPAQVTVVAGETVTLDFELDPAPQTVAAIGRYADHYADHLAPYGYEVDTFTWNQIDQVTDYSTIITAYGTTSDTTQAEWDAFTAATDANGTGVVFTDHAFGTGNGIPKLEMFTGQPESTGGSSGGGGAATSFYEVTVEHPILAGYQVGDRIPLDDSDQAKWIAWFGDYSGDGREVLATMGRDDATEIHGNGIAVQERANNRYALLSTHGVSATRDPSDWTEQATMVFLNAMGWVTPPPEPGQPTFTVYDLQVDPDLVKAGEDVGVSAQVKNVGLSAGSYTATLTVDGAVEGEETVDLESGETATVSWTVSRDQLGTYGVRVGTESDSFRVRAPLYDLTVHELEGGPLAGATVELVDDSGALLEMGTTDEEGQLTFETTAPSASYALVVRHDDAADGHNYLLTDGIQVSDDTARVIQPTVGSDVGEDAVAVMDLAQESVDDGHEAGSYVRPDLTADHSFRYDPGTLVASLGDYDYVHVHQVSKLEQDWWWVAEPVIDDGWNTSAAQAKPYGGELLLDVASASYDGTEVTVDWGLADGYGHEVEVVLSGEVRPFLDLPEVLDLEDVTAQVRAMTSEEGQLLMRLRSGSTDIRAGSIGWDDRPVVFEQELDSGVYKVIIEADTGSYSGELTDDTRLRNVRGGGGGGGQGNGNGNG